jgi:hypothetical protein
MAKPRRLPSTWQAARDAQLAEINEAAAARATIPSWRPVRLATAVYFRHPHAPYLP